jgi:CobQ-like glutamine amidotransferase family enzyme
MLSDPALRIGILYPDRMRPNGDHGNLLVLINRCRWRGIAVETASISMGETLDPAAFDLLLFGGGQDWPLQEAVAEDLKKTKERALREAAVRNVVMLATGGGYQLCGQYIETLEGKRIPGAGLLDMRTIDGRAPMTGAVILECGWLKPDTLVGFERHTGRSYLGRAAAPLGRRLLGRGNNGEDPSEGCRQRCVFGTNLHGPVLAHNPHFADHLIRLALQQRHGDYPLSRLDDTAEWDAHRKVMSNEE